MQLTSIPFLIYFLPILLIIYYAASFSAMAQNGVLFVACLLFYSWGDPQSIMLLVACILLSSVASYLIKRMEGQMKKIMLYIGVGVNLFILFATRYMGTFLELLGPSLGVELHYSVHEPMGMLVYILHAISYLVDVYRKESKAQKRFGDLLLYIAMFPQLIAGPIVRYGTIAREINKRQVSWQDMADGSFRFIIGLGKKVILANQLSEVSDQFLAGDLASLSTAGAWVGLLAFTLQIYFDFSGYSDMAIGIGRCLGFHFKENFDHPYCCNSITDFWRRWHISLGSFFRDYLYIPLGGNRRHQFFNILVVWFLTGMWHGASWNFILWGVYFGLIVALEKFTILRWNVPAFVLHLYSLLLVILGWGIFYFVDFSRLTSFFQILFGQAAQFSDFTVGSALRSRFWLWIGAVVFCLPVGRWLQGLIGEKHFLGRSILSLSKMVIAIAVLSISVALLVGATNNPFIYTRF